MCAICLEDTMNKENSCMIMGCEHTFHKDCITNLLVHTNSNNKKWNCPLCRRIFTNVLDLDNENGIKKYEIDKAFGLYKGNIETDNIILDQENNEILNNLEWDNNDSNIYIRYFNNEYNEIDNSTDNNSYNYENDLGSSDIQRQRGAPFLYANLDEDEIEFEQLFQEFLIKEQENENFEMERMEYMNG